MGGVVFWDEKDEWTNERWEVAMKAVMKRRLVPVGHTWSGRKLHIVSPDDRPGTFSLCGARIIYEWGILPTLAELDKWHDSTDVRVCRSCRKIAGGRWFGE